MDNEVQEIAHNDGAIAQNGRQPTHTGGDPAVLRGKQGLPGPGRPKDVVKKAPATPEEVRALLFMVLDKHTSDMMVKSLRKKIAKGNVTTLEFLFDRIIGRPAVTVNHEASGALQQFIGAWQQLVMEADLEQSPPLTIEGAEYREIDLDMSDDDDEAEEDAE